MTNAEEARRIKAMGLRYKKPVARGLNLYDIEKSLWEISDACADVQYYIEHDGDTLLDALDGDEDDAYEFRVMFSSLAGECERMQEDLRNEYVPEYFDTFFAAVNKGGEMLGYDTYEQDYYGLGAHGSVLANEEAAKKLRRLTKDELVDAAQRCFQIFQSYIGLQHRYDCIKAAMDILHSQNTGHLQIVRQIEALYEKADEETDGFKYTHRSSAWRELGCIIDNMPQEAWVQ